MRRSLTAIGFVLVLAGTLRAEPLDRRQVAADAKWLLHVDFDAMKSSQVARKVLDGWLSEKSVQRSLDQIRLAFGTNLPEDLHSLTVYGSRFEAPVGVAIVRAKVDGARLRAFLAKQPDFRSTRHGAHEVLSWTEDKDEGERRSLIGALPRPGLMVVGQNAAEVTAALAVLDGKAPPLLKSDSPLDAAALPGTILHAAGTGFTGADVPFQSHPIRHCELLRIAIGEDEGKAFARAELTAKTTEEAEQFEKIVSGFLAIAQFQFAGEAEIRDVLKGLKVSVAEQTLTIQWQGPAEKVLGLMKRLSEMQPKP